MLSFVQHPAGDLSLLARAATEPQAQLEGGQVVAPGGGAVGGVKRRKTAPRKLATFLTSANSNGPSQQVVEEEEEEREKENQDLLQGLINRENLLQQANKLMHPVNLSNSNNKAVTNNFSASNTEPTSLDLSLPRSSPPRPSSEASSPPASPPSSTLSLLSSLQQVYSLIKEVDFQSWIEYFTEGPIYFYLKIVIYRNQMFEMKRDTKKLEILIASYDHSTKARPTLSLLW